MSAPAPFDRDFFAQRQLAIDCAVAGVGSERQPVDLFSYSTIEPPPAELQIVRRAHKRARTLGLALPKFPRLTVEFVHPPERLTVGAQTRRRDDGTIQIAFVAGQPLDGLPLLVLHELRHAWQFSADIRLSLAEAEEDAERFAWDAMQGWK